VVISPKVCKIFTFLARRDSEDMRIILAGDFNVNVKDNYNANLQSSWKIPSNLTFFRIFLLYRYGFWTKCGQFIVHELYYVLELSQTYLEHNEPAKSSTHWRNYKLNEMWTIYPAWTTFRTLAIIDLSWTQQISKPLNSLAWLQTKRFGKFK
jgi:hypothetical protein